MLLSSCFVSLPSQGTAETKAYHGREVVLTTKLDLATTFSRLAAWEHPADHLGDNQHIVLTLSEGSLIQITGSRRTRAPWGDSYCAACVDVASGTRFDLWEKDIERFTRPAIESETEQAGAYNP